MYHSITISGKNLYDEWGLIPTSRPLVNPPEVKTTYVKNPGSDGSLDFTDNLTGEVQYSSRKGSWEFWIRPEDQWADIYSAVMNYLHGIEHEIILEDEPESIYHGRLSVSSWKSDKHNSLLVIDYQLDPYKESIISDNSISPEEYFITVNQYKTVKIEKNLRNRIKIFNNTDRTIYPRIYSSDPISIIPTNIDVNYSYDTTDLFIITSYSDISYNNIVDLNSGYNDKHDELVLYPGDNYWLIDSSRAGENVYGDYVTIKIGFKVMTL